MPALSTSGSVKEICPCQRVRILLERRLDRGVLFWGFHSEEMDMRKLTLTLLAGVGALIASNAYAADEIQIGASSPLPHQARSPGTAGL
jgi:hypothetical protein